MKYFFGHSRHQIDGKNRIRIPPKFKDKLGQEFYVARGTNNCIYAFSEETMEKYSGQFENSSAYDDDRKLSLMRHFFNSIEQVGEDNQGRVLLPQDLVNYAGIVKDIIISGSGDRLEIWSADKWEENVGAKAFDQVLRDSKGEDGI